MLFLHACPVGGAIYSGWQPVKTCHLPQAEREAERARLVAIKEEEEREKVEAHCVRGSGFA